MPHSVLFSSLSRALRIADDAERRGVSTREALSTARELDERSMSRRRALAMAAGAAVTAGVAPLAFGTPRRRARIGVLGAGLAGLVCADALRAKGHACTVLEASGRVGGRCSSIRGYFPGQTAELGGEFIDTTHQTMRQYATEFGLARDNVENDPGEVTYYFGVQHYFEDEVVAEYRRFVPRLRADLRGLSAEPSFFGHTAADVAMDNTTLAQYLEARCGDLPLLRKVLDEAYVAEYGLETSQQSALNMVLFLHADRRRRFAAFGNFSDERFHLTGGNDAIATRIAARLPGEIVLNAAVASLAKQGNEYRVGLADGRVMTFDFVVCSLPATVVRTLNLDASLGLSADQLRAIQQVGYGDNAKTMVGFASRPWAAAGSKGAAYSDLTNVQATWETNRAGSVAAGGTGAVLTDYASGVRGATLMQQPLGAQVGAFLGDLGQVWPGAAAAANGLAVRRHWPSDPLSRGSYTCYRPGQFTSIAGLESVPAGGLKFAGEHTDSFYSWQGFMEGACLSGVRAAGEVLRDLR